MVCLSVICICAAGVEIVIAAAVVDCVVPWVSTAVLLHLTFLGLGEFRIWVLCGERIEYALFTRLVVVHVLLGL